MSRKQFYTKGYTAFEFDERKRRVLEIVADFEGRVATFVDIGCSDGSFTMLLREAMGAHEAHGVELSPEACRLAKDKGVKVCCLDVDEVETLPYADASIDLVHAGQLIEHLFDTDRFLMEVHRILKPEGAFVISTPNLASWYNRLSLLLGFQPYNTSVSLSQFSAGKIFQSPESVTIAGAEHLRVGTKIAWHHLFEAHSFEVARVEGISVGRAGVPLGIKLIDRVFAAVSSLASVIVFVLMKRQGPRT